MPSFAVELRQKRAGLVEQARAILKKAEGEKRGLLAEERATYDTIDTEITTLGETVQREERTAHLEAEMSKPTTIAMKSNPGDERTLARRRELRSFIMGESGRRTYEFEARALQADSLTAGGATFQVEQFVADLIKAVDDAVVIRSRATVLKVTSGDSLGAPSLDADPADADWTAEIATGSEDSTMKFGKRALKPHPLAKRIKVSDKLLRASALDVESLVSSRLAYKFAVSEEKGFMTGTGAGQPLGVFTASADGISTGRDTAGDNTGTDVKADTFITALYNLKPGYQMKAAWLGHRDLYARIRKLKDANGQYLWAPGLAGGAPDTILNKPVLMSEYAPKTFTTGLYVGLVGDFTYYWIADSLAMTLKRLEELYAETAQVGFIGRLEVDGAPVLEEAFTRIKMG